MCKFGQNISNDVKRTTKFYVKSKLLSIYIYIENLYTKKFKSHFSIWHILNVREHCKLHNAKIQVKCFHCQMFPLSNVSIVKCFHCQMFPLWAFHSRTLPTCQAWWGQRCPIQRHCHRPIVSSWVPCPWQCPNQPIPLIGVYTFFCVC